MVDGPDEEGRHLGSGYGLVGAVVENAKNTAPAPRFAGPAPTATT